MHVSIRFSRQGILVRNSFHLACMSVFASVGKVLGKKFISFGMHVSIRFSRQDILVRNSFHLTCLSVFISVGEATWSESHFI